MTGSDARRDAGPSRTIESDHETARSNGQAVALVTGSARRVGAEIVRALHGCGYRTAVHYLSSTDDATALCGELEARRADSTASFSADIRRVEDCRQLVTEVVERFGRLDVLVNNASTFYPTPLDAVTEAQFDDLIGTNFKAPLFVSHFAAPYLKASGGCVVNITDIHTSRPKQRFALYSAAKAALANLTRSLAAELGPEVRVNAVAPGAVLWPEDYDESTRERILSEVALARAGGPDDIATAVRFLVTEATYTTGHTLYVDGGRRITL